MKRTAIITDDVELNREILAEMLGDDFRTVEARNGFEALAAIEANLDDIAVLLLDLVMPEMDGHQVLAELRRKNLMDRFPILVISSECSPETETACLRAGITDFIAKPFTPGIVHQRVSNSVALFSYKDSLEEKVAEQTRMLKAQTDMLRIQNEKLTENNVNTIELLGNVVEARNLESGTHIRRVKGFTMILARRYGRMHPELNLTEDDVLMYGNASIMHDLGKIMIRDSILLKPGKLTAEEFEEMKRHTIYGCEILENSRHLWEEDYYRLCLSVCRSHHEKWSGEGYPDGLKGDQIPLVAQLVSVADCFDALTTVRPYKKSFPPATAYAMIKNGECGSFNPVLMACLDECKEDFFRFAEETGGK